MPRLGFSAYWLSFGFSPPLWVGSCGASQVCRKDRTSSGWRGNSRWGYGASLLNARNASSATVRRSPHPRSGLPITFDFDDESEDLAGFGLLIAGLPDHSQRGLLVAGRDQLDQPAGIAGRDPLPAALSRPHQIVASARPAQ